MMIKKDWKSFQLDYDQLEDMESRSCCVCISQRTMTIILATSDPHHWVTRYYSDEGRTIDANKVDEWAAQLEKEIMSGLQNCCGGGYRTRIGPGGVFQITYDGETWTDAPELDPRNTSMEFQPLPLDEGLTTKCAAAMNIRAQLQADVDYLAAQVEVVSTLSALASLVLAIAAIFLSGGALTPLAVALASAVWGAGGAAVTAAFTGAVYDAVQCAFYEHSNDDGSITQSQIDDAYTQISETVSGLALVIIGHWINLYGPVGMTNLGRSGGADGDECDECQTCMETASLLLWQYDTTPDVTPSGWTVTGGELVANSLDFGPGNPEYTGSVLFVRDAGDVKFCRIDISNSITPSPGGAARVRVTIEGQNFTMPTAGGGVIELPFEITSDRFTLACVGDDTKYANLHWINLYTNPV